MTRIKRIGAGVFMLLLLAGCIHDDNRISRADIAATRSAQFSAVETADAKDGAR